MGGFPEDRPASAGTEKNASEEGGGVGFPIVGIGASAGGLEAFEQFFTHLPADSGLAFVLVQHLDPAHKSILSDLVGHYTTMTVAQAEDGVELQPGHVYTIPPNRDLALLHGRLQLLEPAAPRGRRTPIDFFFRSLAQDQRERAIGIVLSGTGTEGTMGIKAIKEAGGMVMVQSSDSASYDSMPRSAAATGLADFVLPPAQMPEPLLAYVRHPFLRHSGEEPAAAPPEDHLQKACVLLRHHTGHDFSQYKPNTLLRRLARRQAIHQLDNEADYIRYLQENPREVEALFKELLIPVTSFFRDPDAFAVLAEKVVPALLAERSPSRPVRIWVPGCATGEEAYSLAMLLREGMDALGQEFLVEIFATDIDAEGVAAARQGVYPEAIVADVSPARLQRFFTRDEHAYRVKKSLRDWLVFAEQSLIKDPPFSKLDLISCRNLLIYLGGGLQQKVLPLFHYALNPGGYLFLGNSETIGAETDLFTPVDRKWKLFQCLGGKSGRAGIHFPAAAPTAARPGRGGQQHPGPAQISARELAERDLLAHYGGVGVLVDEQGAVLYIHGRSGRYLEPATGEMSADVLSMARAGLRRPLSAALRQARTRQAEVRRERVRVRTNGDTVSVNLTVRPVADSAFPPGRMLIVLEEVAEPQQEEGETPEGGAAEDGGRITELEQELRATREYLQSTIEELETANEELKSTNEELQSTNEELQSTNEELETSQEEQQSVNEELQTVNTELQNRVEELSRARSDMQNLLASTEIGTVFLDMELKIQRFTPAATKLINLIDSDVGRSIGHLVTNLEYGELLEDAQQVLDSLVPREREVRSQEGRWYEVRLAPYRTTDNVIDGLVVTFVDITVQKRAQAAAELARALAENVVDAVNHPLVVLDADLRVASANRAFYRTFQTTPAETQGWSLYELGGGQWEIPRLRELLEGILPRQNSFDDFEVTHHFEVIGRRSLRLDAREIRQTEGKERMILLAIEVVAESGDESGD